MLCEALPKWEVRDILVSFRCSVTYFPLNFVVKIYFGFFTFAFFIVPSICIILFKPDLCMLLLIYSMIVCIVYHRHQRVGRSRCAWSCSIMVKYTPQSTFFKNSEDLFYFSNLLSIFFSRRIWQLVSELTLERPKLLCFKSLIKLVSQQMIIYWC